MNDKSSESTEPRSRDGGALPFISVAIAVVTAGIMAADKWTVLPPLMRYLWAITVLFLSVALLTILYRKWVSKCLRGLVRDRRTKRWLRTQLPALDIFVRDLQRVVADGYEYSLAAVVDGLIRDAGPLEEMRTAVASLRVLRQWVSCFSSQWKVAKQRLTTGGARHLLVELRFLLKEVQSIGKQCEAHVPTSNGEVDEVHNEPAPYADVRHKWKQFCAAYNRLVDDYQAINKQWARHLRDVTVFQFDKL